MSIDDLKQKTVALIRELRNIRDEALGGNLEKHRTWFLMREKLNDYKIDTLCDYYEVLPEEDRTEFYQFVKWHYWNILYSLFGEELTKFDPDFERLEVPVILPSIEFMLEPYQSPKLLEVPQAKPPGAEPPKTKDAAQETPVVTPAALELRKKFKDTVVDENGLNLLPSLDCAADIIYNDSNPSWGLLQKVVLKPDGTSYSESACKQARERAKAKK
jgi:hypothetical protein